MRYTFWPQNNLSFGEFSCQIITPKQAIGQAKQSVEVASMPTKKWGNVTDKTDLTDKGRVDQITCSSAYISPALEVIVIIVLFV